MVTADQAALWTDSRYHIQATEELDSGLWLLMKSGNPGVPTPTEWLPHQIRVGIDPFLIDADSFRSLANALRLSDSVLVEITPNLVDEVWTDKPVPNFPEIQTQGLEFSGKRSADKIADLREAVVKNKGTGIVVSALDDVACRLTNISVW